MCLCESHIVFVQVCSLLYMPLTQILGIVVHYTKFYSILFWMSFDVTPTIGVESTSRDLMFFIGK